jgi:hypothetical protein
MLIVDAFVMMPKQAKALHKADNLLTSHAQQPQSATLYHVSACVKSLSKVTF